VELVWPLLVYGLLACGFLAVGAVARLTVPGRHAALGILGTMGLGALGCITGLVILGVAGVDAGWGGLLLAAVPCSATILFLGEGGLRRRRA
jgi:hypothetical protein